MAALRRSVWLVFFFFFAIFFRLWGSVQGDPDYKEALSKSILFFQGQRSGRLPSTQNITWRSHSGLSDGSEDNVDLVGGYYDSGDNVKFNFPMAFTTTMLSWGTLEYGGHMSDDQLENAQDAISWSADYLLKCATATAGKLYVGVGDPNEDHKCWERPEDMDTPRTVYSVSPANPGSDVAGETAAALAAASMVFRSVNSTYAGVLLETAKKVMQFANQYRGAYSDKLGSAVCPFYCSYSGYQDELLWGAAWLFRATNDSSYSDFIKSLGAGGGGDAVFSWDNKFAGANVLLSGLVGNEEAFEQFKQNAEKFMCSVLPNSPSLSQHYTPGGLIYQPWESNIFGYATATTFLLTTYAKYMATSNDSFSCGDLHVTSTTLTNLAKRQVDYILGENPLNMSYMVGFGNNYPKRIHHRGSSIPSVFVLKPPVGCQEGLNKFFHNSNPNPNILTGAIVGGPDQNDSYSDDRTAYSHSEPSTYINAAIVGPLTYFAAMNSTT